MDVLLLSGLASAVVAIAMLETLIPRDGREAVRIEDEETESRHPRAPSKD